MICESTSFTIKHISSDLDVLTVIVLNERLLCILAKLDVSSFAAYISGKKKTIFNICNFTY
jgi:hypothetical protein